VTIDEATLDAMQRYGGSFVQQLARLYLVADPDNREKLQQTFWATFVKYAQMAHAAE